MTNEEREIRRKKRILEYAEEIGNIRKACRHFDAVLRRAGLAGHTPKDLRDTFASWPVSLGAPVAWVSEALGHSSWAVTARHYARWIDDATSRELAPTLAPGDVWPDLLARVGAQSDPEATPNRPHADFGQIATPR